MSDHRYIELTQRYIDEDVAGRYTVIERGVYGVLIEKEEEIDTIFYISTKQKLRLLDLFKSAATSGKFLALVAGYPCVLSQTDFSRKSPYISIPPWEVI
jgi:hypothetical protein